MSLVFRKPLESEKNIQATLYVGNLDPQVTEPILYELFIQFAPVRNLNLPKDRILRTHQGYGFVEFRSAEDVEYVMNILKGIRLYGKNLVLNKVEAKEGTNGPTASNPNMMRMGNTRGIKNAYGINSEKPDVGAKLFVKGLNPLIDEKYLVDTFSSFGTLIRVPEILGAKTGETNRYAVLTYEDFALSDRVIEKMNKRILMNSNITVTYAFKDGTNKRTKHGDKSERLLAEKAYTTKSNGKKQTTR